MSKIAITQLQKILNAVETVRSTTNQPDPSVIFRSHDADLVVHTWLGARLYVYLLDKPIKVRDMRALLKENGRCGIGSLFIIAAHLAPKHGEKTALYDWLGALYALGDGWIYTYDSADGGICQLHFTETAKTGEYYCWHDQRFKIDAVSIRRRAVKDPLRGDWMVGDLASPIYRRQLNYERSKQHFHYQTKYTQEVTIAPIDQLRAYYELLEIESGANEQEVKAAYRKMALKYHPDTSEYPKEEAEARFRALSEAYDFIKKFHDWS